MAAPQWDNKPTLVAFEPNLDQLLKTFTELASSVNAVLNTISAGLNAAKGFLIDDINPLLLALEFILDQMIVVIDNLRNTGVYIINLYPSEETHSTWYKGGRTEKILFRDLLPGFAASRAGRTPESDKLEGAEGFYILQQQDVFNYLLESLEDEKDLNRPPVPGVKQIVTIDTKGKDSDFFKLFAGQQAKHFTLFRVDASEFHVWYNWSSVLVDPIAPGAGSIGIEIDVQDGDTANVIKTKTINALNAKADFTVSEKSGKINVVYDSFGSALNPVDRFPKTDFDFRILRKGLSGTTETHTLGAVVIFAGALTSDQLKAGNLLQSIWETFLDIANLFKKLFGPASFGSFVEDLTEQLSLLNLADQAAQAGGTTSAEDLKAPAPNWDSIQLTRMMPPLGDALDSIEGLVQGLKESLVGASSAIQLIIDFIDTKLQEIQDIQTTINDFLQFIEDMNTLIENLGRFEFATLYVPPQPGGMNVLIEALRDKTRPGRPDEDLFYCAATCFVSAGTGFNFIAYLLGLTDSFSTGADETAFNKDALEAKYNL